jgi:hypothetical protein
VPTARWSGLRHDLSGESAFAGDDDEVPVSGADGEELWVVLLEDAEHVRDLLAGIWAGPAPADHNPLANIGRREPDLKPITHAGCPFASLRLRRRAAAPAFSDLPAS